VMLMISNNIVSRRFVSRFVEDISTTIVSA
jgi:hypothetical protein